MPPDVRAALRPRCRRCPDRVRELEAIIARTGTLYPRDYWAPDCLLGNWTGGSMGAYLRHYPRYFGACPVRDVGLIASEGRMTIPLVGRHAGRRPRRDFALFRVHPRSGDGKSATDRAVRPTSCSEGRNYYILPTTAFGLYRYDIHDVVRVAGFHNQTPLVEFLSKGAHFSSVTGEKLSEYHVTQSMAQALRELDLTLTSYSLAPCWDEEQPYYGLFMERGDLADADAARLTERLDALLKECNIEYGSKRDSLRLGAVRLERLDAGTWREWDRERLKRNGGSLEQYKHPCLITDQQFAASVRKSS